MGGNYAIGGRSTLTSFCRLDSHKSTVASVHAGASMERPALGGMSWHLSPSTASIPISFPSLWSRRIFQQTAPNGAFRGTSELPGAPSLGASPERASSIKRDPTLSSRARLLLYQAFFQRTSWTQSLPRSMLGRSKPTSILFRLPTEVETSELGR